MKIQEMKKDTIVCACAKKSLGELEDIISEFDIRTVGELGERTGAGTFCKSCVRPGGYEEKDIYLIDLIEEYERENSVKYSERDNLFMELTNEKQLLEIGKVVDERIRYMLQMDGGDMEIISLEGIGSFLELKIKYLGACGSCAVSEMGTLGMIDSILKTEVCKRINVKVRVD